MVLSLKSILLTNIPQNGGETGMNTEVQQAGFQKQLQVAMPIVMTVVTSFQPAALQLYFVFSAILGGLTSQLLKTPAFRRVLGMRQLPTKESNALYSKVVKGEVQMSQLRGPDGKIRYQAPNAPKSTPPPSSKKTPPIAPSEPVVPRFPKDLNLKPGIQLPAHMRAPAPAKVPQSYADRDLDFERGTKGLGIREKVAWTKRNYKPLFVWRRMKRWLNQDNRDWTVIAEENRRRKAQEATRRYEVERKRRLEGR